MAGFKSYATLEVDKDIKYCLLSVRYGCSPEVNISTFQKKFVNSFKLICPEI